MFPNSNKKSNKKPEKHSLHFSCSQIQTTSQNCTKKQIVYTCHVPEFKQKVKIRPGKKKCTCHVPKFEQKVKNRPGQIVYTYHVPNFEQRVKIRPVNKTILHFSCSQIQTKSQKPT